MKPPLDEKARHLLAESLGEAPEHVIALHALRTGRCKAIGDARAALIEPFLTPKELLAFGTDADAIVGLLGAFGDWNCVEVGRSLVEPLAQRMAAMFGKPIKRYGDVFLALASPAPPLPHPAVRLLTAEDADFYARCVPLFGDDPVDARRTILEGPVAAAIVDGIVVSTVEANVRTSRYANLTADTLPAYQNRGLASACAAAAARAVQAMELIPVWSTGERNFASLHVAEKVGFKVVSRWTFLSLGERST